MFAIRSNVSSGEPTDGNENASADKNTSRILDRRGINYYSGFST